MSLSGTLDATVEADRVSFSFSVENAGDEPVTLSFRTSQTAEFVVLDGEDERWRWSDDKMFAQMLGSEDLGSGESVVYDGEWPKPESGTYTAIASLEAEDHDCEARTRFLV